MCETRGRIAKEMGAYKKYVPVDASRYCTVCEAWCGSNDLSGIVCQGCGMDTISKAEYVDSNDMLSEHLSAMESMFSGPDADAVQRVKMMIADARAENETRYGKKRKQMHKTAVVTKCDYNKSWQSAHGEMHGFSVAFENGDSGFYMSTKKDQPNFVVGQEAQYEISEETGKSGKPYTKIKVFREKSFGGGGSKSSDRSIRSQVAVKAAVDLLVSHPKYADAEPNELAHITVGIAEPIFEFLEAHS